MDISVIILAAGKSKRMHSAVPKVLYPLAGIPLLERVIKTARAINPSKIYVVYGENGDQVREQLSDVDVAWVRQTKPLGTGHAVMQTLDNLDDNHRALILYSDVPLISGETLKQLLDTTPADALGWLTSYVENPKGLGRILRDRKGRPRAIVEEREATETQKTICEINTGICLVPVKYLKSWLPLLRNNNTQKEYYLTDLFQIARQEGVSIQAMPSRSEMEILAVNDQIELMRLERLLQRQMAEEYMRKGLRLFDPNRFDVRGYFVFGQDVVVDINVILEGEVSIGSNCYIGPNVLLKNVIIGNNVEIKANSVIEDAVIGKGCVIGPFARIRPGTRLKANVKIGNFVEIKKSEINEGSKVSHLTYIGDATIGKFVNVGAGTVTCNYDGVHKYQTVIGDSAFVGSNTTLVAPIEVGKEAYIGAGSTITDNPPKRRLTLGRARQVTIEKWVKPRDRFKKEEGDQ